MRSVLEVDIKAIKHNIGVISHLTNDAEIMAVVKADCYGLGVGLIEKLIDEKLMGRRVIHHFAVSTLKEALEVREITKDKVYLLGHSFEWELEELIDNDIVISISNEDILPKIKEIIVKKACSVDLMLVINTGMGRMGMNEVELSRVCSNIVEWNKKKDTKIIIDSMYSHYAISGDKDNPLTQFQKKKMKEIKEGYPSYQFHSLSSRAILNNIDNEAQDRVRTGTILYGYEDKQERLRRALTLKSKVLLIKELAKGDTIGYGATYTLDKPTRVATLSIGYYDGYSLGLSNRSFVAIKDKRYPVIGEVSMDYITVDIGEDDIVVGEEVVVMGGVATSFEEVAQIMETDVPGVICSISKRVQRRYK